MLVSVCVVAYNEEKVLPQLLHDIENQDYTKEKMEIGPIECLYIKKENFGS